MPTYTFRVLPEDAHQRLDLFLTESLNDIPSRTFVQKLIHAHQVLVNNTCKRAHYSVRENDEIAVEILEEVLPVQRIEPENIPLDIYYQDEDLCVVNKPSGMLVHPAQGIYSGTLVNALLYTCPHLSDYNTPFRPGIVHRLDRETSGLLVVAKNNRAHARLAKQFQKRTIQKSYLALVQGEVAFDQGLIEAPLGRNPLRWDKQEVRFDDTSKEAITYYRVLRRSSQVSFLILFPKTGRTHQLRVHLKHLGHPVLGDAKYGRKETFSRLALHAFSLGFRHPSSEAFLEVTSLPPKEFLEK